MSKFDVQVGDRQFPVDKFKYDKTALVLEIASEIANKADIPALLAKARQGNIAQDLMLSLPRILRVSRPLVLRGLAISLIPDKELIRLLDDEEVFNARVDELVELLREECDLDKIFELGQIVLACIGLNTLKKWLPSLTRG